MGCVELQALVLAGGVGLQVGKEVEQTRDREPRGPKDVDGLEVGEAGERGEEVVGDEVAIEVEILEGRAGFGEGGDVVELEELVSVQLAEAGEFGQGSRALGRARVAVGAEELLVEVADADALEVGLVGELGVEVVGDVEEVEAEVFEAHGGRLKDLGEEF